MKKYILPICLWVSLVAIIVLGIVLSDATFSSNKDLANYGAIKEIYKDYTKTEVRTSKLAEDAVTGAKVISVYDVYEKDDLLGYAYVVSVQTHSANVQKMNLLIAMNPKTEKLVSYKVLSCDANDYYNSKSENFDLFANTLKNTLVSEKNYLDEGTFTGVSGATSTTNAIVSAIKIARVQFYKDINKELPVLTLSAKLNKITQDLSVGVFNSFNAEMTVVSDTLNNAKVNVKFTYDFETAKATFVSADKTLSAEVQALCMSKISLSTANYIKSHNAETGEFVVVTYMSFGSVFTTTLTVDAAGQITAYDVETSAGFTANWKDYTAQSEAFIGTVPGNNISGVESLEYVSGATFTSNALKDALTLVKGYFQLGGNE